MRHKSFDAPLFGLRPNYTAVAVSIALCCAMIGFGLTPAAAETKIEGQADDLQIHAEDASIREIFDALSARFNLTYNSAPNGRALTGLYSGSLTEVLARVLAGNDYVLGVLDDRVRVVVVNASTAEAPTAQVVASNDKQVAQLTTAPAAARPSVASKAIPPLTSYLR
jgi:hypothetical protein